MNTPYTRAPHQGGLGSAGPDAPHAALLIDFDNVTMGMRSDLSKALKSLLDSDVIKGKVSVQRAYADWRRYPQYIVPLSEASVDLIFAPAYGSNKKNATDIRMAIDAVELVFIRPEIGTYILLTGDSDFSSLVLKLKEYGKYVIGVGIQESSSDILVQNCDEYYSYTSLTGLTKTTDLDKRGRDPWILVKDAVAKMVSRGDVMRSDRLKQVMQELDPSFDEGAIGFSKFSKFLAEASSRGLVHLRKLENGQYEIGSGRGRPRQSEPADEGRPRRGGRRGGSRRDRKERDPAPREEAASEGVSEEPSSGDPLRDAYDLLTDVLANLRDAGRDAIRDSDVKRKLLEADSDFDETELGFPKFSRFLAQAADHGVVLINKSENGNVEVSLPETPTSLPVPETEEAAGRGTEQVPASEIEEAQGPEASLGEASETSQQAAVPEPQSGPILVDVLPSETPSSGLRLGPRRGSTRRRGGEDAPSFFEGQVAATRAEPTKERASVAETGTPPADVDLTRLGLPSEPDAIVRYLTHRYKGVGEKTAVSLVERFGTDLFSTLRDDPTAIERVVPTKRAEQVLEAWGADYARRVSSESGGGGRGDGERTGRDSRRGRSRGQGGG
jgi:uncharacterized protein (TIGR00288 family)